MLNKTRIFTLIGFAIASMGLSACETVKGAGKDLQNASEAVEKKL